MFYSFLHFREASVYFILSKQLVFGWFWKKLASNWFARRKSFWGVFLARTVFFLRRPGEVTGGVENFHIMLRSPEPRKINRRSFQSSLPYIEHRKMGSLNKHALRKYGSVCSLRVLSGWKLTVKTLKKNLGASPPTPLPGTGIPPLRTADISKNHIKSTKMVMKKSSPEIERSRSREFQKNGEKNLKTPESFEIFIFVFSGFQNN